MRLIALEALPDKLDDDHPYAAEPTGDAIVRRDPATWAGCPRGWGPLSLASVAGPQPVAGRGQCL